MKTNEDKALGQILAESMYPATDWALWGRYDREKYNHCANAVKEAVLAGLPEWGLVPEGTMLILGDECWSWSLNQWVAAARTTVFKGDICRRRLSSLVSVVPPEDSPEGVRDPFSEWPPQGADVLPVNDMFQQEAEREMERQRKLREGKTITEQVMPDLTTYPHGMGNTVSPAPVSTVSEWKLPEPPKGREWMRAGDWTEEMLPEGCRPLLRGEDSYPDDEYLTGDRWRWSGGCSFMEIRARYRTRRPLPTASPSESPPSVSEVEAIYEEAWAILRRKLGVNKLLNVVECAHRIVSDLDAFEKRVMEAEKQTSMDTENIERIRSAGMAAELRAEQAEKRAQEWQINAGTANERAWQAEKKLAEAVAQKNLAEEEWDRLQKNSDATIKELEGKMAEVERDLAMHVACANSDLANLGFLQDVSDAPVEWWGKPLSYIAAARIKQLEKGLSTSKRCLLQMQNAAIDLTKQLSTSPWIPISTPPKEEDAVHGSVLWRIGHTALTGSWFLPSNYTHWQRLFPLPSESPEADPFEEAANIAYTQYHHTAPAGPLVSYEQFTVGFKAALASTNSTKKPS